MRTLIKFGTITLVAVLVGAGSTSNAGFISSNGCSLLTGILCQTLDGDGRRTELQLRFNKTNGGYLLRQVLFIENEVASVEVLSGPLGCESSSSANESVFDNRCRSTETTPAEQPEILRTFPRGDQIHFRLMTLTRPPRMLKFIFESNQCQIVEHEYLLPNN